jgi:hypothetical protein
MPSSRLFAAGPTTVRDLIRGEDRPALVLGTFPTAIYLRLTAGEVIAVLTRDAVQLPLGLRLPTHSRDDPLDRWTGPIRVGSSQVRIGDRKIRLSRSVSVRAPTGLEPSHGAIVEVSRTLGRLAHTELWTRRLTLLESERRVLAPATVVGRFLGVGPGLTPSGDDILAGFLIGASAFDLAEDGLRTAVVESARVATTDLSAALLRCASRGESIPQMTTFLYAMSGDSGPSRELDDPLLDLIHVGHTSGTALALGTVAAARVADGVHLWGTSHVRFSLDPGSARPS